MKNINSRRLFHSFAVLVFVATAGSAGAQQVAHANSYLQAELISFQQVPSVLAASRGSFQADIQPNGTITFMLSYANMSSPVAFAHIHFGASKTNGGIMVFLCGGTQPPQPACPASGTITGTITAADVSTLPVTSSDSVIPQGILPGDLAGMITAILTGNSYVNVHTATFPSGEIRGQVHVR